MIAVDLIFASLSSSKETNQNPYTSLKRNRFQFSKSKPQENTYQNFHAQHVI